MPTFLPEWDRCQKLLLPEIRFDSWPHNKRVSAVTNALSCSTSPAAVRPNPLTTAPVTFRKKARSSRASFLMPNDRRPFRLRFRDGRSAPAPFPPSLRLRFTFPLANRRPKQNCERCGFSYPCHSFLKLYHCKYSEACKQEWLSSERRCNSVLFELTGVAMRT